jgi:hypothetical protein
LAEIPEAVRRFIVKHIHSVDQLELLVLLRKNPQQEWRPIEISKALERDAGVIEALLKSLESTELITYRDVSGERRYSGSLKNPDLLLGLQELSRWYSTHRVSVVGIIFSKPNDKIQTFADAFRIRQEEDE